MSAIPHRVRAIVVSELGDPSVLRLQQVECPPPGPREVRIRVHACGVNFPDMLMAAGLYQVKPPLPFIPGMEAAGEVIDIGDEVRGMRPGDRVFARTGALLPAFAEEITVPAGRVFVIPEALDFAAAAALYVCHNTSYHALKDRAGMRPGETLVVFGAAGGVGLAGVQIGKAMGARVIAVARGPVKRQALIEEGADAVIDYGDEDVRERVKELTGGKGADVFLDPVGGALLEASLRCIAPGGRVLVVGFTSGEIPRIPANIVLIKEIDILGVRAGEYALRHPEVSRENIAQLLEWAASGRCRPRIARTLPLERAADALRLLAAREVVGKVVLTTGAGG